MTLTLLSSLPDFQQNSRTEIRQATPIPTSQSGQASYITKRCNKKVHVTLVLLHRTRLHGLKSKQISTALHRAEPRKYSGGRKSEERKLLYTFYTIAQLSKESSTGRKSGYKQCFTRVLNLFNSHTSFPPLT